MRDESKNSMLRSLRPARAWMLGVIMIMWSGPVQSASPQADVEAKLRARIGGFWDAMVRADYATASSYIQPSQRSQFIHEIPKSRVLKWKIDKLSFSQDGAVCDAVTLVTKPLPLSAETVDWPLRNRWVLLEGDWYFTIPWEMGRNPLIEAFKEQQDIGIVRNSPERDPFKTSTPEPTTKTPGAVEFTPDVSNPTTVHVGEKTTFRYRYANKSTGPLTVASVHADCHCTSVPKEYPVVPPGGHGNLEVVLDTFGLPLGRLHKGVHVQFREIEEPVVLTISVENAPNFQVIPTAVDFGSLSRGAIAERSVRFTNKSGKRVQVLSHFNSDPALKVSLEQKVMGPDDSITVVFRYQAGVTGEFLDNLMLRTDLTSEPLVTIPVRGRVGS